MAHGKTESLITALQNPALYDHPIQGFELLETHISWVLLTGPYVYKIKKPVDFGFLDFTTLEKRRFYCQEELRLNRRLAPDLYLAVVSLSGSPERPSFANSGKAIEYAVKMRQFSQDGLLSRLAARNELKSEQIDEMAAAITAFHEQIERAAPSTPFGSPDRVHHWVAENFEHIRPFLSDARASTQLETLQAWSEQERQRRRGQIQARKDEGFVRECHGDLHLGNMALVDGRITCFDCIEFNEDLRWIDVMSEVAFVVMDLCDRGHPQFAYRFLNHYLERTGDYAGTVVLRYYLAYRALVRGKVALLRLGQGRLTAQEEAEIWRGYQGYVDLALSYSQAQNPALIITHGVSGSGKSTLAVQLVESLGALRVRSDVERKRLFGFSAKADTQSDLQAGIYTPDAARLTYARLAELAAQGIDAGFPVIVDATFLKRSQRNDFRALSVRLGTPFLILAFQAPETVLRERVAGREGAREDASEAGLDVLDAQLRTQEPLSKEEMAETITIDTAKAPEAQALTGAILEKLHPPG